MTIIQSKGLYKSYDNEHERVDAVIDCNLQIEEGECVIIYGDKDSGKTTLLNLLGGFERPTSGMVYLNQHNLTAYSDDQLAVLRRKEIGYLFQKDSLIPEMTVYENILIPVALAKNKLDKDYFDMLVYQLHLTGVLSCYPRQLTTNQFQCATFARALINNPSVILADEPTEHLYVNIAMDVIGLLKQMVRILRKTLVITSQDSEISEMANHIIRLQNGYVVEDNRIG